MIKPGLKHFVEKITTNDNLSIEERIETVMNLRSEIEDSDEKTNLKNDVVFFSSLIDMVKTENAPHIYDEDLLSL